MKTSHAVRIGGALILALTVPACGGGQGAAPNGPSVSATNIGDTIPSLTQAATVLGSSDTAVIATVNPNTTAPTVPPAVAQVESIAAGSGAPAPAAGFGQISVGTFFWQTSSGASGEWMTAPATPLTTAKTLIVVHGLMGNVQVNFPCAGNIKTAGGYGQVIGYGYDWSQTPASQAPALAAIVNALPAGTPVDIEAHSLGALVTLAAIPAITHPLHHVVFLGGPLPPTGVPQANPGNFFTYLAFIETLNLVTPYAPAIIKNVLPYMKPNGGDGLAQAAIASGHENGVPFTTVAGIGLITADGFVESPQLDGLLFNGQPNDGLVLETAARDTTYLPASTTGRVFNDGSSIDNHIGLTCSDAQIWTYVGGQVQP